VTLNLHDVCRSYQDGDGVIRAVDHATMRVQRGEFVALFGPSGSGKTTLLLMCAGIERPDAGSVTWDGRELGTMSQRERRAWRLGTLGIVPQRGYEEAGLSTVEATELRLLSDRRRRPSDARRIAIRQLNQLGLGNRIDHPIDRLSGGERQRVALARALSTDPSLLLADEPTGNLDSLRGQQVLEVLRTAARDHGRAVVLVTHDERAAELADRTLTLTDGRLESTEPARSMRRTGG
jgi:ABC-type lipoprotein export system ATPase subunit